jgi:phosphoribosylaminoimidazole-succinocarboxamide synthase
MALSADELAAAIPGATAEVTLEGFGPRYDGKVRDLYSWGDDLILITTDRISAFDSILGLVPYRGQVLNQLSAFWFERVSDIVATHIVSQPDPNVTVARRCETLPIEVVVRGYLTGVTDTALWRRYELGERTIYGIDFPDGMEKNAKLDTAIITPTTKAEAGAHDERITSAEVVELGLLDAERWEEVQRVALALFARGTEVAAEAGLVLVDTKYEFGVDADGTLVLIDEIHTPDSSRYWVAATLEERLAAGEEPENSDKEVLRLDYKALGYTGEGEPPALPDELAVRVAQRYIGVFEALTGTTFVPGSQPAAPRIVAAMAQWADANPLREDTP